MVIVGFIVIMVTIAVEDSRTTHSILLFSSKKNFLLSHFAINCHYSTILVLYDSSYSNTSSVLFFPALYFSLFYFEHQAALKIVQRY